MSWNGFVKAVNRATTAVMQQTGAVEKTVDKNFENEEKRFKLLETRVEKIYKEAKGYLDAVRAITLAQQRIGETIDNFYDQGSDMSRLSVRYKDALIAIDEQGKTELDNNYRTTVLDPIGKLIGVFPDYNEAIKKRSKKLLDYDRLRSNVKKLVEKPSDDPQKLPRAEQEANQAKEVYESINRQLSTEIPELVNLRVPYLNPSFEAILKSQLAFNEFAFQKLDAIKSSFPASYDRGLEGQAEGVLQQIRELSICKS